MLAIIVVSLMTSLLVLLGIIFVAFCEVAFCSGKAKHDPTPTSGVPRRMLRRALDSSETPAVRVAVVSSTEAIAP